MGRHGKDKDSKSRKLAGIQAVRTPQLKFDKVKETKDYTEFMVTTFKDATTDADGLRDREEVFSDGSLSILNSNFRQVAVVKFKDLFPVFLTSLEFEATDTDVNYFTAEVTFKYTIYEIVGADGRTPL